jgi:hypothetical protein
MNKIQKLTLALLVLGSIPGGLWAMDSDDEGEFFVDEADQDEYRKKHWKIVPYVDSQKPAEVAPPAVTPPVQHEPRPAVTVVESGPVIYFDQRGEVHNTVDPTVVTTTKNIIEKLQLLMTKKGLCSLTGLVLAIVGLRYVYVSSVIKQIADLRSLHTKCDEVLKAVLKGYIDAELVEVNFVFCCGLDQELQDKLDGALSGYNIALQQVCHELCAHQGDVAHSTQVQRARSALAACQQIIEECEQVLIKKPTVADSMLKKGSVWAQDLTARVQSATKAVAHRFKRQGLKKP